MSTIVVLAALAFCVTLIFRHLRNNASSAIEKVPILEEKSISSSTTPWEAITPLQHRPFKPIYHITMGLQSTSPEDLIVIDQDYRERLLLRRELIKNNRKTVMGVLYDSDGTTPRADSKAAVDELYSRLMESYLPARFPHIFTKEETNEGTFLSNAVMDTRYSCKPPDDPLTALEILGETVEDDLLLLQEENTPSMSDDGTQYPDTSHRLVAFICCFPAGFDTSTKLGLLLKDIHAPVPGYNKIGPSMERFFSRLSDKPAKRLNWSVQTHTNLFAPTGNHIHEGEEYAKDASVDIQSSRMRVECQTMTRMPKTRAVLFSFKTYLFSIEAIKDEGSGPALADAIEGLQKGNAPGMWTYKGGVRWGKSVMEYLRS